MPKTYAEIRKLQKLYGYDNLSTDQFSQLLDKVTGTNNYKAGQGTGLGSDLKQLSYGVDQALSAFNLPETFGRAGELAFGESGRKAFEGLPRATVDMLPFLAGGLPGAIAGGATIGVNTYEKTDSPGAGAVSGILSTLMPFAGRGGAAAGRGLFGAAGGSLARTEATAFGAANGLPGVLRGQFATDAAKAGTAQLLNAGGVLKSAGARAAEFYGAQAGMFGANVATQALTNATAAEKGQGWNAAKQALAPENLLVTALSQTPFMAQHYLPRVGIDAKQRAEVDFVKDYATTLNRYDKNVFEPVRAQILEPQIRAGLQAGVAARQLALPAPKTKADRVQQRVNQEHEDLQAFIQGPFEMGDGLLSNGSTKVPFKSGNSAGSLWTDLPLSGKISALNSTDAQEASAASLLTNKTTPEQARDKVVEKRKLGVSSEDAVQEVFAQERAKAERKLQAETLKEERRTKDAETKAVEDQSKMQFIDEWTKRATPEQLDAFKSGLRKLGVNSQADASVAMASAVRNWVATGEQGGVEGLSKYLETTARYQNNAAVDKKAPRTLISKHATKAEASLEADKLRVDDTSKYYQLSGTDVVSWPWLETRQLYGEKARETFAGEERAAEQHLADVHKAEARLRQETSRPEDYRATELHREATETDAERFVAQMDDEVLAELGGGDDAQRGQERMEALLHTIASVKGKDARKLELAKTKLWTNVNELDDWIRQAAPHVQEYATKLKQVTANVGKKFLGTSPSSAGLPAGGGFFYNVGALKNGKLGKHTLPNSGNISVVQLEKIGRGTDQPLTKAEVALYKTLVPEAFAGENVNVPVLLEGLRTKEPTVEVVKLGGQESNKRAEIIHALDTKLPDWRNLDYVPGEPKFEALPSETQQLFYELQKTDETNNPDAARYSFLGPKAESDMPGYVEGLVRVPAGKDAFAKSLFGQSYDNLFPGQKADVDKLMASSKQPRVEHYTGPHFGEHDTNVVAFFRGYMETLPDGKKAFHVIEVQSDWGQARRKAEDRQTVEGTLRFRADQATPSHPLLTAYENLALKAAIRHARESGADSVILSDAETAMMTEGHDQTDKWQYIDEDLGPNQRLVSSFHKNEILKLDPKAKFKLYIPQEAGMRLHYDTTLPSELRKITGDKGVSWAGGVHEKGTLGDSGFRRELQQVQNGWVLTGEPDQVYSTREQAEQVQQRRLGSPVFKDATGQPKTQITGRLYDISKVPLGETAAGGKEMSTGTRVETPNYIGERQTLGRLLQSVGLTDHVDEVSKLVTLFDKADAGFAHLQQAHGQDKLPLGLFTVQGTGEKLIWLSAVKDPATRKLFALTHELNGHLFWDMAENGKLDAVATKQMNDYRNMVTENTPFANQRILDEVWGMLPEKYKADKSLQDIVKKSSDDPEEVLANINAVVSLAIVHATPTKWASFLQNMPKPVADFVALIARYGRKIYESISGLQFSRQMGWSSGQIDVTGTKALHGYVDNLHKLLKYDEQRANQARQAIKVDLATDTPLRYATALSDGQMFNEFGSDVGATIAKHFGAKNEVDPLSGEKRNKLSGWLDRYGRMESFAVKHPQFREAVVESARRDAKTNLYEARILEPLGIRMKGAGVTVEKDNPLYEVYNDPRLSRVMSQLTARQLEEGKPLQTLLNERHGPTMEIMQRMMPEEQRKVRETFVRHQQAQQEALTVMRESQYENLALSAARILMDTDATKQMRPAQAEALGRQATTAAMNGQPDMASPITPFIVDQSVRIEKMMGEFAAREEFISTRRFGKHSLRVEYADPNKPMKALSFDTPEAAERFIKENSGPGVVISKLHRDKKPFNVSEAGLDFLLKMERESTVHLQKQLEAYGIEPGKAAEFAAQHNLSDSLSRELAARQIPSMSPHRRLVEGYEDLNTLRQQVEYTRMMVRAMTKRASNTKFQLNMLDPALVNMEPQVKQQLQDQWNNYLRPDPKSAHMVSMLNYVRYLGLNFLNMAQDTVQPLTGALIPSLINEGFGVGESYKHMTRAMKDVAKEKFGKADLTSDERAMLEEYKKGNRGLATFSDDAGNNDYIRMVNDDLAMREGHVTSLGEKLSSAVHAGILTMKNLHKHFTDGAMETSMLATYRLYKSKGLTHAEAQKQAFDATIVGMGAGGKGGRQPGLWNSSPTVGATLTALQTYAFHQIGTWKATAERAFGRVEGLSKAQRKDALKAVGVHTALMLGQAGIFGLPLVGALMAIIDKTFGINSKEEVAALLSKALPEDESRVIQQIALHGIINGVGGVDYASRGSVPGVLGLNPQDGFSADSLLGPTYSVIKDVFGGAKGLVTGEPMEAAKAIVPNTLKRGLQAWRDDWEFRRKDGSLIDESTPWDQSIYAVLGLKPARVASLQERDQWQRVDAEIEQQERNEWLKETSQLLESGDILNAKKAIHDRLVDKPGESPAAVAEAVANEVVERQYPKDTSASPGASARLNQAAGLSASQLPEMQRMQLVQVLLQQLGMGLPATQHSIQTAQMIDQLRVQQPWLSRQEALAQIAGLTGQAQKRSLTGLSYGLRP